MVKTQVGQIRPGVQCLDWSWSIHVQLVWLDPSRHVGIRDLSATKGLGIDPVNALYRNPGREAEVSRPRLARVGQICSA